MKELIKVNMDNINIPTVLGRDLHKYLKIKTKYTDWFNRMLEYGFKEDIDYTFYAQKRARIYKQIDKNRTIINHQLTLEMAKHISMVQRNEMGMQIRNYFLKCEDMLKGIIKIKELNKDSKEWQELRIESKKVRLEETDEIKRLVEYARKNNSKNADKYYTHYSNLIWRNLFTIETEVKNKRNILNESQLHTVMKAEYIIKNCINEGLYNEIDYHDIYKNAENKIKLLASLVEITKIPYYSQISMI
jgi:anti-repressor protein